MARRGTEPTATRPYWPALDGWRGLTIWIAISVHAGWFTAGGVLSLDTFFVLSGFLITGILVREWRQRSGAIDLARFWARRARRLLPALFVVLGAVLVYAAVLAPALGLDRLRGDTFASLFYAANWRFVLSGQSYFAGFTTPSPLLHLWSLAVEEQFYLIWPMVVLGVLWCTRRRLRPDGAVVAVGVVAIVGAVASALLMAAIYVPGTDPSRVYYGTDTRAQAMLVGAALAVAVTLHGPLRTRAARRALSIAATGSFVIVVLPWFASSAPRIHDLFYGRFGLLVYSFATAVVIWRLTQPDPGVLGRGLRTRPMRWVGDISYEMYLWHWPLYLVLTPARTGLGGAALLALRLSTVVVFAAATHFLVGEPIRRGVRLRAPRLARFAAVTTVLAVGVGVVGSTTGARPALTGDVGELASSRRTPAPAGARVDAARRGTGGPIKVMVVGDSQGATLAQAFDADPGRHGLTAQPGMAVWNRAILGCSITSAPTFVIDGARADNRCGAAGVWQEQWARDVATFDPDVVVVHAGAWDLYDVVGPDGRTIRPGDDTWGRAYRADVAALYETVSASGARVVAIRPPCYGDTEVVGGGAVPAERLDATRIAALDAVWSRVARAHGSPLLDLNRVLCPRGRSDPSIRPDGAHYDDGGADRVATLVADAIRLGASTARRHTARPATPVSHLTAVRAPSPGGDGDFTWFTHPTPAGRTVTLGVVHSAAPGRHPAILVAPSAVGLNVDYLPYARRLAARGFDVAVSCWFAPTITPELADVVIPCPDAPVYGGIVDAAVPEFDAVVEAAYEVFGTERELAVLGPSRGAAIAALRASAGRPEPVVLISGRYEGIDPVVGAGTDVVARASGFRAPVLVLHGTADAVIPVGEAQHLEAALRARGADVVARYYEGAGHNLDGEPVAHDDMEDLVVEFLCARLTCSR